MRNICVIGGGPAGLLAAHAATIRGCTVTVISNTDQPSKVHGASYLHSLIPHLGLDGRGVSLHYQHIGTAQGYATKVYGKDFDPKETSWYKFDEFEMGWNLRQVYERLWHAYSPLIKCFEVDHTSLEELCTGFDLVVNTAPQWTLQPPWMRQLYLSQYVVIQDLPTGSGGLLPDFTILYDGRPGTLPYRVSNLWGHCTVEYREGALTPQELREMGEENFHTVAKPTRSAAPVPKIENLVHVGRFGRWEKGALSDQAFWAVWELLP